MSTQQHIPSLFDQQPTVERQVESWEKVTPQLLKDQRLMVLKYLFNHPLSTHIEICEGLRKQGYTFRDSSVQGRLTEIGKESHCLIDVSGSKLNKERTRRVTAYCLNRAGNEEVRKYLER